MAKAVLAGRRVVLVTAPAARWARSSSPRWTRPTTTVGWARSGPASWNGRWAALGVTEWENLGYHDSDMMGRPGNLDPRNFWQADLDEAARRLVWLIRRYQPDVITTYNDFGGYGHPDHIRTHDVAVRAFPRAGDAAWYPEQLAPEHGGSGPAGRWRAARALDAIEALRAGHPGVGPEGDARAAGGDRRDELLVAARRRDPRAARRVRGVQAKMLVPDEIDHDLDRHQRRAARPQVGGHPRARHADRAGQRVHAVRARGLARGLVDGGLHPARVERRRPTQPESDLFAGIA